jgi:hypothetical protein
MQHPLIINSNGKPQKIDPSFKQLSALGQIIDRRTLVPRKFIMAESDWDDIVNYSKQ